MKKFFSLLILTLSIITLTVQSQSCLPEGISFGSQAQIDSFAINYPNCTEIEGDVEIHYGSITNLNGLNILVGIGGNLNLYCVNLEDLTGLENLNTIDGDLRIQGGMDCSNDLISLSGLDNLTTVGGSIELAGNWALSSLIGLGNLTYIGGDLIIGEFWLMSPGGNPSLTNLAGLDNLDSIGGYLQIYDNNSLVDLSGIESLKSIGDDLFIILNNNLSSLSGIENLTYVGGELQVVNNEQLTNLSGLIGLTTIGETLSIYDNVELTSLNGLENIDPQSISNIGIANNLSLSSCELQWICDYLVAPSGSISIYNNAEGCNSPIEVANNCGIELSCLPFGNYHFTSQEDVDNFQSNYPGCTDLEGTVSIRGNDITNIDGLSVVTSIEGSLLIMYNPMLTNIQALEHVISVGGSCFISNNSVLSSLEGLDSLMIIGNELRVWENNILTDLNALRNLTSIGGMLDIYKNDSLINLSGLEGITSIDGDLWIRNNNSLTNLSGLDNLTSIGGKLSIGGNASLSSLSEFNNLTSIGGSLEISQNNSLTSLTGLDNIDADSIEYLHIYKNASLSTCEVQSICDYLVSPNGYSNIYDNALGCDSEEEVQEACPNCLAEGITFTTQAQIDSFAINYPGCTEIEGDARIEGEDAITNLNGIHVLKTIGGSFWIADNYVLKKLTGLDSLTSIGGDFGIMDNSLTSLNDLSGLTSIGGYLFISGNDSLTNLIGLDNIDHNSISDLTITYNNSLPNCDVQSICNYLISPKGTAEIHDNAQGCNSQLEVEEACASSIIENSTLYGVKTQPNPFSSSTTLSYELKQPEKVTLTIYDYLGKQIYHTAENQPQGKQQLMWNAEGYADGIYYYRLKVGDAVANGKMVKVR